MASEDFFWTKGIYNIMEIELDPISTTTKCPQDITDAHNPTTKIRKKNRRSCYSD
jgi:hypothetical protein